MSKADKADIKKGSKSKRNGDPSYEIHLNDNELPKRKKRKRSCTNSEEGTSDEAKHSKQMENENAYRDLKDEEGPQDEVGMLDENIDWPQNDLRELVERMKRAIPEKDSLNYNTRVEKLNWDEIAFNNYPGEECKKTWSVVQKRIRRFRLLSEVLEDAHEWLLKPWPKAHKQKPKRHPDMPKKPLSAYMIFCGKKKDKIAKENPNIELTDLTKKYAQLYKELSPAKKEKYLQMAAEEKKVYEEKIKHFHLQHPEIADSDEKPPVKKADVEPEPEKPLTPFRLFFEQELEKVGSGSKIANDSLKQQTKEQWRNLPDKKKVVWINLAADRETKYNAEIEGYLSRNPTYEAGVYKPVLTKEERQMRERCAGKPVKPPCSAYSLFSSKMLQGDEIKKIESKDRMRVIATQWKNFSEEEKDLYKERVNHMMEQYKLDFASYLESLPEDRRQQELQRALPKRKPKNEIKPAKRRKEAPTRPPRSSSPEEPVPMEVFQNEPTQPPVNGYELFAIKYKGSNPEDIWKTLTKAEKDRYHARVRKFKEEYLREYTQFLQSLSKKQLKAFYAIKQSRETKLTKVKEELSSSSSSSGSDSDAYSEDE